MEINSKRERIFSGLLSLILTKQDRKKLIFQEISLEIYYFDFPKIPPK